MARISSSTLFNFTDSIDYLVNNLKNGFYCHNTYEKLPIVDFSLDKSHILKKLVGKILEVRERDMTTNTTELEKQIDEIVYKLYELTDEEIAIIEGKNV